MSEIVYLRPLSVEDAKISCHWRNNSEIWKHSRFIPSTTTTEESEKKWLLESLNRSDQVRFAICVEDSNEYIGNVQLIKITNKDAEFHLFIGDPIWWGKGVGRQATRLLLNYAFIEMKLQAVTLEVHEENMPAIAIYNKQGFIEIGTSAPYKLMELTCSTYFSLSKPINMIRIITLNQKEQWMDYVKKSANHDFYHTWTYHSLDKNGVSLLFVFDNGIDYIAFPLIKREIPETDFYDFSSVYGYSGPISNKNFMDLEDDFLNKFKQVFLNFLSKENIVSVFSRLHPFFDQDVLLQKFGCVWDNGKTIALDLTISIDEQRARYQNRVLRQVKQMRKKGYYVKQAQHIEDIRIFLAMYTASMLRLDASKSYMFSEQYFIDLLGSKELDARLLFVYNAEGCPICGAIVVFTNQIIQAHLLATSQDYYAESPAKLLTDEITLLGRDMGMKYYNLGGGLGYKEDNLYNWKTTFSKLTFNYKSWRFIVDPLAYNMILNNMDIDPQSTVDHFPLYRSKLQTV